MNPYIRALVLTNSLFCFAEGLFIPMYALFVAQIGGNAQVAGLLFGTKFVTTALVELVLVRLKDRASLNDKFLQLNFLIRAMCWSSLIFFPSLPMLFVAQMGIGLSEAIGSPAYNSLISEHLDKSKHTREWAFSSLLINSTVALASILSGFIVTAYGFSTLFAIMTFLAFISFLFLRFKNS